MTDLTIYVVTHGPEPLLVNDLYQPIRVGLSQNEVVPEGYLADRTGKAISEKNANFCELTAAYWITYNAPETSYVGLCHYRRYFNPYNPVWNFKPSKQKKVNEAEFLNTKLVTTAPQKQQKLMVGWLQQYDLILPVPYQMRNDQKQYISLTEQYAQDHDVNYLELTKKIIVEMYPEMKNSVRNYLDEAPSNFHMGNMMITSRELWISYHERMFPILFRLEEQIEIPADTYQQRIFGFISERLVTLYFYHHAYRIKQLPLLRIFS